MTRIWWAIGLLCFGLLGERLYWTSCNRIAPNFHEVIPGEFYRSAQPFPEELKDWIKSFHIKTVINLRGENLGAPWYQAEAAAVKDTGANLINISYTSEYLPPKKELKKLIIAFKNAPKPILVHCRVGADRTGEASALYQMLIRKAPVEEALKMLSIDFFHVSAFMPAKRHFIESFKGEEWALTAYDPCAPGMRGYYAPDACG